MKIFLYSDLHISRTSSILPLYKNPENKYTYRQNMIINLGKYMQQLIMQEQPDMIINLGDTFDQHTLTSYDIKVATEFFKLFKQFNIPHYVIVGNHEMINNDFNAVELLDNIENIQVIKEACNINNLAFLPYCNYKEILELPEGEFLFSHQDIEGSVIRGDFKLPAGIDSKVLQQKYKFVFNGHIHKPSISKNIINVGSCVTHSFSDDENCVPQCYIFDTESFDLKTFKPTMCPLFRKLEVSSVEELQDRINKLDHQYCYILHIICAFEDKEDIKQLLEKFDFIINFRINIKVSKDSSSKLQENKINTTTILSKVDMMKTFKEFLKSDLVELKFPLEEYNKVLSEVKINE